MPFLSRKSQLDHKGSNRHKYVLNMDKGRYLIYVGFKLEELGSFCFKIKKYLKLSFSQLQKDQRL